MWFQSLPQMSRMYALHLLTGLYYGKGQGGCELFLAVEASEETTFAADI